VGHHSAHGAGALNLKSFGPDGAYETRLLAPPDLRDLQSLFDRCADYFKVATGAPAHPEEAQRAFVAGPPTKSVDDKRVIGVFRNANLVGVIDALVDWPEPGVWSLGMFMLDPEHRNKGLGGQLMMAFERWCHKSGAQRFRTAIVTHHESGIRFLERSGYAPERTVDGYNAGSDVFSIRFYTKHA